MSVSQAIVNPWRGSIQVIVGPDDEGTDLSTEHALAPWPVDDNCVTIASEALSGMGWTVTRTRPLPETPDKEFILDVVPAR